VATGSEASWAVRIVACGIVQAHDHIEAPVAFEDPPGRGTTDAGGQRITHVCRGQSMLRGGDMVDPDVERGQAGNLLHPHVGGAVHRAQFQRHLLGHLLQGGEIIAVHHHRQVRAHAGNQLVEAQLDRLAELETVAQLLPGQLLEALHQRYLVQRRIGPLRARLQHDHAVGDVGRHRVDGRFGGAGAREHRFHFRLFGQRFFQRQLHRQRLLQRRGRHAQGLHRHVAFVQGGHELAAQQRERTDAHHHHHHRTGQHRARMRDCTTDHRLDARTQHADQFRLVLAVASMCIAVLHRGLAHQQCGHCRHEGEGEDEGADQGQHEGGRHRVERLALHTFQGEDRREHQQDDQLAEGRRPRHLHGRIGSHAEALHRRQRAAQFGAALAQHQQRGFDHDHRAIHQDAEIQRAQAHQVAADAEAVHAYHGEQERPLRAGCPAAGTAPPPPAAHPR